MDVTTACEHRFSEDQDCILCGMWKDQYIKQLEKLLTKCLPLVDVDDPLHAEIEAVVH